MNPSLRRRIEVGVLVGALVSAGGLSAQQAATPPGPPAAKSAPAKAEAAKRRTEAAKKEKLDPAAAQGEVEAGINALAQGKPDAAVTSLSNALAAGSLPQNQTARAMYYRGVAHRRQAKPAQAISDLTSALWIKGGLSDEQRADALQQRSAAYREAGLPDQAPPVGAAQPSAKPGTAGAKQNPNSVIFSSVAPSAPSSSTVVGGGGGFFSSLFGGASSPAAEPSQPVARAAPVQAVPVQAAPVVAAGSVSQSSSPKPATRMVPVMPAGNSMPMGFQEFPEPVRQVEVSTQARAAQPSSVATGGVARPWEEATKVRPSPGAAPAKPPAKAAAEPQVAVVQPGPPAAQSAPAPSSGRGRSSGGPGPVTGGGVQLQVAAVRSAEEAQGLAAKLQSKYARELGGRAAVVDQTSVGTLGTLYRVHIGPFASARDTDPLCAKLKGDGMDCRVVGQ